MTEQVPIITSLSRVWTISNRAGPNNVPSFKNFLKMTGVSQSFGSITPIYNPDPGRANAFVQVGEFADEKERPTTSLQGHYALAVKSFLLEQAKKGCAVDIQLHIGKCEDPSIERAFEKILIFEGAIIESYSTDDMGALEPGERSKVDETGDISAIRMYEFSPLAFASRGGDVITTEILDVALCDNSSCGDCDDASDGCEKIYAISKAAGGSPGTPADVVFSVDSGVTWAAHDIDTLGAAVDPDAVDCIGLYLVVVSNSSGSAHFALLSDITASSDPSFTEVSTGFVAGGEPNDISSIGSVAYIVGDSGFVYKTSDIVGGVSVIDSGSATTSNLNAVDALSKDFAVAVGQDGVVIKIQNDLVSAVSPKPVGLGTHLECVFVKTKKEWWIGDSSGVLHYTVDGGASWSTKALPVTATEVLSIEMSSESIMYVAATVLGKGEIFISTNGGNSFIRAPRDGTFLPSNDKINALAVCADDVDFVVAVGLNEDGSDGVVIVGNDAAGTG